MPAIQVNGRSVLQASTAAAAHSAAAASAGFGVQIMLNYTWKGQCAFIQNIVCVEERPSHAVNLCPHFHTKGFTYSDVCRTTNPRLHDICEGL